MGPEMDSDSKLIRASLHLNSSHATKPREGGFLSSGPRKFRRVFQLCRFSAASLLSAGIAMRLSFTIRDLLWLTLVVALVVGWWVDRRHLRNDLDAMSKQVMRLSVQEDNRITTQKMQREIRDQWDQNWPQLKRDDRKTLASQPSLDVFARRACWSPTVIRSTSWLSGGGVPEVNLEVHHKSTCGVCRPIDTTTASHGPVLWPSRFRIVVARTSEGVVMKP